MNVAARWNMSQERIDEHSHARLAGRDSRSIPAVDDYWKNQR